MTARREQQGAASWPSLAHRGSKGRTVVVPAAVNWPEASERRLFPRRGRRRRSARRLTRRQLGRWRLGGCRASGIQIPDRWPLLSHRVKQAMGIWTTTLHFGTLPSRNPLFYQSFASPGGDANPWKIVFFLDGDVPRPGLTH